MLDLTALIQILLLDNQEQIVFTEQLTTEMQVELVLNLHHMLLVVEEVLEVLVLLILQLVFLVMVVMVEQMYMLMDQQIRKLMLLVAVVVTLDPLLEVVEVELLDRVVLVLSLMHI